MSLLRFTLTIIKKCSLTEMVEKACTSCADFSCVNTLRIRSKSTLGSFRLKRATHGDGIWIVTGLAFIDCLSHVSITLVVMGGRYRTIDGYLMKVRTTQSR